MGERATIDQDYLYDIADAIREKKGVTTRFMPAEMKPAILSIPTGGGVDVEALSVTANGTYTAPTGKAYSPVTVNVSGGGGNGHWISNGAIISNVVGVVIQNNTVIDSSLTVSGYEYSAGYEGINIQIFNLEIGHSYTVSFDYQTISGGFFPTQYTLGFKISSSPVTSYPTDQGGDASYTPFTRDFAKQGYSAQFNANAETMYLVIAMVGYQDSGQNAFEITNMSVTDAA